MTIIDYSKKYIFISNMKTASTYINNIFAEFKPDILLDNSVNQYKSIGKHSSYLKLKHFLKENSYDINDFYIFFFIREPVSRLISCFNYETNNRKNDILTWYNYNFENNQTCFEDYIKIKSHHFKTIDEMIFDENGQIPPNIHIFKYEDLQNSIQTILMDLNLKSTKLETNYINKSIITTQFNVTDEMKQIIYNRYNLDANYYI
jgi:hypothetical protein